MNPHRIGRGRGRVVTMVLAAVLPLVATTTASARQTSPASVTNHQEAAGAASEPPETGESPRVEAELVASTIFQSGLFSARLGSPLVLDTHWFGLDGNDAGLFGLAWEFRRGGFRVLPGFGWGVLEHGRPTPAVMVRWAYDSETWISQGALSLALRTQTAGETPAEEVHGHILDGVHVSRVIGAFEVGPLIEHIRYREEKEWKAGARVAWRLGHGVKVLTQVVAPDPEVRIGLSWEP